MRSIVSNAIEEFRLRTKVLAVLDNPSATMENRAEAIEIVLTGNPNFWLAVAKRTYRKPVSVPAPVPEIRVTKPAPALTETAQPAPVPAPQSRPVVATAPARTLQSNPAELLKTWIGYMRGIVNGKNMPWPAVQSLTTRIFTAGMKLSRDEWELLFTAMKAANSRQNPQHIITRDAKPAKIFKAAPVELIEDFLFGHEGVVPSLTGEVADCDGELPVCLQAKTSIVLDAIEAVDNGNGLDEQEERLVNNLLNVVEAKNAPDWLIEKGKLIWGSSEDVPNDSVAEANGGSELETPVSAGGLHIIGNLSSVVHPHPPVVTMATAKVATAEFVAAAATSSIN
jgi:hypothetical protein